MIEFFLIVVLILLLLMIMLALVQHRRFRVQRNHWQRMLRKAEEDFELQTISIVSAIQLKRHDWMNDLQMIYGYMQLRKFDKVIPYLEILKQKLQQESSIGQLGFPRLELFLLIHLAKSRSFEIELEIEAGMNFTQQGPVRDAYLQKLAETASAFDLSMEELTEEDAEPLYLELYTYQHAVCFAFRYEGEMDVERLLQSLKDIEKCLNIQVAEGSLLVECSFINK